jgi:ubiquinone/menaquinone biosynthesis C-methylase UbiE
VRTIHRAVRRWFDGIAGRPTAAPHPLGDRTKYKDVWNDLASSPDSAKMHVAGYLDEGELTRQAHATVDVLRRYMGFGPADVILEIGCGIGRVGQVLAPLCAEWIGTDISGNMLAVAADRLRGVPHVRLVELNQVGLAEIPESSVDRVYCTVVFMHLYEWDRYRYVQEAFRVLRPGGRAYFDNVDIASSHGWKVFMETAEMPADQRPAHVSMVSTGEELETYAHRAGFDDVTVNRFHGAWVAVTGTKTG